MKVEFQSVLKKLNIYVGFAICCIRLRKMKSEEELREEIARLRKEVEGCHNSVDCPVCKNCLAREKALKWVLEDSKE